MSTRINFSWPLVATNQASPEVTVNTALQDIDTQMKTPAATSPIPASHTATGVAGQIAVDSSNIYLCVATNSWVRISTSGTFLTSLVTID